MNEIAHPSIHSIKARRVPSLIDISDGPSPTSFNTKRSVDPPYSTPSLIANHFNIPSVFYDSSNKLIQIDPCILKVKLLTSKKNLSSWIGKHL